MSPPARRIMLRGARRRAWNDYRKIAQEKAGPKAATSRKRLALGGLFVPVAIYLSPVSFSLKPTRRRIFCSLSFYVSRAGEGPPMRDRRAGPLCDLGRGEGRPV
jgi:hypothetical protein